MAIFAGAAVTPAAGDPLPTAIPVPPAAPTPTSGAVSPGAPDPHPPRGGIAPDGSAVGGQRLLSRELVLPLDAPPLPRQLSAQAWLLADLDTGDVLAARDPHGRYQPASIQKLLTTVTLVPRLAGDRVVTVSDRAALTEGSHAGLVPGGKYTVDDLFRGLLLVSGNDAAEALADAAGGRAATVRLMNATARRLGAYDTFVETPSGLDGWNQLTSAYDMTLILRAAITEPRFLAYDRATTAVLPAQPRHGRVPAVGRIVLDNQNTRFLTTVQGALVAKTGFTDAAQHTFAGVIERRGHRFGVVLLRAQRWPTDQWQQARSLVAWGLRLPATSRRVGVLEPPDGTSDGAASPVAGSASRTAPQSGSGPDGSASPLPGRWTGAGTGAKTLVLIVLVGALYLLVQRLRRQR